MCPIHVEKPRPQKRTEEFGNSSGHKGSYTGPSYAPFGISNRAAVMMAGIMLGLSGRGRGMGHLGRMMGHGVMGNPSGTDMLRMSSLMSRNFSTTPPQQPRMFGTSPGADSATDRPVIPFRSRPNGSSGGSRWFSFATWGLGISGAVGLALLYRQLYGKTDQDVNDYLHFLVIGDQGDGPESSAPCVAESIAMLAEKSAKHGKPIEFIIGTGDNFYPDGPETTDDEVWRTHWEEIFGNLGIPWYLTLGNHDRNEKGMPYGRPLDYQAQIDYTNKIIDKTGEKTIWNMLGRYYSFTWPLGSKEPLIEFFMLDGEALAWANSPMESQGTYREDYQEMKGWLNKSLGKSKAKYKIIASHYVPGATGRDWFHRIQPYGALKNLREIQETFPITLFMGGHEHYMSLKGPDSYGAYHMLSGAGSHANYTGKERLPDNAHMALKPFDNVGSGNVEDWFQDMAANKWFHVVRIPVLLDYAGMVPPENEADRTLYAFHRGRANAIRKGKFPEGTAAEEIIENLDKLLEGKNISPDKFDKEVLLKLLDDEHGGPPHPPVLDDVGHRTLKELHVAIGEMSYLQRDPVRGRPDEEVRILTGEELWKAQCGTEIIGHGGAGFFEVEIRGEELTITLHYIDDIDKEDVVRGSIPLPVIDLTKLVQHK